MECNAVTIVLHEIYGINQHIEGICRKLSVKGLDIQCPNLLGRATPFTYEQESEAYTFFMKHVGFHKAAEQVKALIAACKQKYKQVFLIGFSAGATVAWLCSEEAGLTGIIGFYGSRIRNYLHISAACPVLLFFPSEEPSFQVSEVIKALNHPLIHTIQYEAGHGFSDPFSSNYDQVSAEKAWGDTLTFISKRMAAAPV
ncbi:dienelactone hydrolase family protein [Domibacillus indicus]|uniref:dienelactone hydrolase family protein n=1 Tax=Domibacillus indicus TaxID=1437523 RepID=UPI00203A6E61|nr:dienelactone hydrolase family protein [Domibacillus indicus]MCM3787186.1 dienelactone hydrolase family protein [Domibacillus indicus]